jgi:hypothetical protein
MRQNQFFDFLADSYVLAQLALENSEGDDSFNAIMR